MTIKQRREILLEGRRFGRAALERVIRVRKEVVFDLALDEAYSSANRFLDFMEEALDNVSLEGEQNDV